MTLGMVIGADAATVHLTGGKLSATNFILGSAATLSGDGEIRAPATLAGTVSPGSSTEDIGILSFSDRVSFDSGTYLCYAVSDTSLDCISVTGNVTGVATINMSRAAGVSPLRQIIIKGGAASDYTSFSVSPSTEWTLGQNGTLDLVVSLGQLLSGVSSGLCADYDGDGKADLAVYDEATGAWKVKLSSAGYYMIITTLN